MPGKQSKKTPAIPIESKLASSAHGHASPNIVVPMPAVKIPKWAIAAVLVFTAVLYFPSLQNGITSFDDDFYIIKNPFLKDLSLHGIISIFSSYYAGNYHPFTTLTYLFEYNGFGVNPLPYHVVNLVLHLANTWLAFKLAERLSGHRMTALIVSVLFAVHPMHVESVAWISERKDVLYTFFYLWALIAYLRYLELGRSQKQYLVTMGLFLATLLSKSAAVTLPVLLIAVDFYKGRTISARSLMEKVPFFALSILFGILNLQSQAAQGAMTDLGSAYSVVNRFVLLTSNLSMYFIKLIAPFGLSALHFYPGETKGMLPALFYCSVPLILVLTWLTLRRNKYRKEIVFGVVFFLITISVMLQLVAVGSALYSERYTYVPYIGLFYIAGQLITHASVGRRKYFALGSFAIVAIVFSVLTWCRIPVWKNDDSLFGDVRKKDPEMSKRMSMAVLGMGYNKHNSDDLEGALYDYSQSILFNPDYDDTYLKRAIAYFSLHNFDSAISDYNRFLAFKPNDTVGYNYRGWAYYQKGDTTAALRDFDKALTLNPGLIDALNNRGWLYYRKRNFNAAASDFKKIIAIDARNTLAWSNLAEVASEAGDYKAATDALDSVLKIDPKNSVAYHGLGFVRLKMKDTVGACAEWKHAAELGNADAAQLVKQYGR